MSIRVRLGAGSGIEVLMAAVSVADADWRVIFHRGRESYAAARAAGGADLVRNVVRFGRFGWINLAGPLTEVRGAWTVDALHSWVEGSDAEELRLVLTGARRHQIRSRLDDATIAAAVGGDRAARTSWRRALSETVLQVSPWLLATDAATIQATCLSVLERMPHESRATPLPLVRRRLADVGADALLEEVAPGVAYRPGVLDDVVLVTSPGVAPILVVLDESDRTVILHPPLSDEGPEDAGTRLREIGRALGDDTRIRLLHALRLGPRTLTGLCESLDSPRTTLLHHLALLRSSGLIEIEVVAGEPNVYALRPGGFDDLARAATAFPHA